MEADFRCKWTPLSLQGQHFITTNFWIADGSPLRVRLLVVQNLFAIFFIPVTFQTEEFINLFVILKVFTTLYERQKMLGQSYGVLEQESLGFNDVSHINILHALVDELLTIELNIKCLWQQLATGNYLEIKETERSGISDPVVTTDHSLRRLQPGT